MKTQLRLENLTYNRRWSDKFLPGIKQILGLHLISAAPVEEDVRRNTDLIVLKMAAVRIACRVRRYEYYEYKDQFTVRYKLPSGAKTELAKIVEGWGDYFFYAFADSTEEQLISWRLCNLNVFRLWLANRLLMAERGSLPFTVKENHDGSSAFAVFAFSDLPVEFVIATGEPGC